MQAVVQGLCCEWGSGGGGKCTSASSSPREGASLHTAPSLHRPANHAAALPPNPPNNLHPLQVVRELLCAHADEWSDDAEVEQFLRDTLRLPPAWLAEAAALWARYCGDDSARLGHLLQAGDWPAAHALLCSAVAPAWMAAGGQQSEQRLSEVLSELEGHAQAINHVGGAGCWESGGGVYAAFLFLRVSGVGSGAGGGWGTAVWRI